MVQASNMMENKIMKKEGSGEESSRNGKREAKSLGARA